MPGDTARLIHSGVHTSEFDGYTKGAKNEIFALKPAPIQTAQGYCGTSGQIT